MPGPTADPACVFCDIVAGRAAASRVFEDEHVVAFLDVEPVTTGHIIVAPRQHASGLAELDEAKGAHMFRVAHQLSLVLRRSGIPCEGVNLLLADGEVAFQEVPHVHLHVFPRTDGDGFVISAQWTKRTRDELDLTARRLRKTLNGPGRSGGVRVTGGGADGLGH